jgi:hypothetical protein
MAVNICVLRSGGEYLPEHVQRLARQVPDLVALSDVPVEGVPVIPLQHDWPGWWAKMELFRPDMPGDLMYFDLDTLVLRVPPTPTRTTVLSDFRKLHLIGSGLMFLKHEDRAQVWDAFVADPAKAMRTCTTGYRWGDQGFLLDFYRDAQRWQDIARVYSWKFHCQAGVIPADADVVCYHGKPRPWEVGH